MKNDPVSSLDLFRRREKKPANNWLAKTRIELHFMVGVSGGYLNTCLGMAAYAAIPRKLVSHRHIANLLSGQQLFTAVNKRAGSLR